MNRRCRPMMGPVSYHMLTRYTGREQTQGDIAAWLNHPASPLPSDLEVNRDKARQSLCDPSNG